MFVKQCDLHRNYFKIIGQENIRFSLFFVKIFDPPQLCGIRFVPIICRQFDNSVASQTECFINLCRVNPKASEIDFRPRNKKCGSRINPKKPFEIQIAFVHQIDCQRLENQFVQDIRANASLLRKNIVGQNALFI